MPLIKRINKGSALTHAEGDANLQGLADGSFFTATQKKKECTAWVNFNSAGVIRDSFNVASVVTLSAGVHEITFAENMITNNYSISGMATGSYNGSNISIGNDDSLGWDAFATISGVRVSVSGNTNISHSNEDTTLIFFGGK